MSEKWQFNVAKINPGDKIDESSSNEANVYFNTEKFYENDHILVIELKINNQWEIFPLSKLTLFCYYQNE